MNNRFHGMLQRIGRVCDVILILMSTAALLAMVWRWCGFGVSHIVSSVEEMTTGSGPI